MSKRDWNSIDTAPKDGTIVRIKGRRFKTETRYVADAVWTTRTCPYVKVTGWFPPTDKHDGQGPYDDVTHWRPAGEKADG